MSLADPFPDAEGRLAVALPPLLTHPTGGTITSGTVTDSKLDQYVTAGAFLRVGVVDSSDDGITQRVLVDIEIFAASRAVAYALAEQIRGIMLSRREFDGMLVDQARTVSGPKRVPWDNNNIRRFLVTSRISTRR